MKDEFFLFVSENLQGIKELEKVSRSDGMTDPFNCRLNPTAKSHISITSCHLKK
ncbi:hypothetical protein Hanom_Chr10g00946191 [Helianthus anomalus]